MRAHTAGQAAKSRMYNKARKSEVATRMKKARARVLCCASLRGGSDADARPRRHAPQVLVAVAQAQSAGGEAALSAVDALLSQAYQTIDKAVRGSAMQPASPPVSRPFLSADGQGRAEEEHCGAQKEPHRPREAVAAAGGGGACFCIS